MFGRGKSKMNSTGHFIMAMGRKVGNVVDKAKAGPSGMGKSESPSRHANPPTPKALMIKKGKQDVTEAPSLAPRTINRSGVRFSTIGEKAKPFASGHTQGGRKS